MTALSLAQVVSLCAHYSNSADRIGLAVAVIFAESGGDPAAKCPNVRDPKSGRVVCQKNGVPAGPILSLDRGLCQFNDKWHPEVSDAVAYDPLKAVGAMFHLSSGFVNFSQWGGFTSGNYKRFQLSATQEAKAQLDGEKGPSPLTAATAAVGGALVGAGDAVGSAANGVADAVTSVPHFLGLLTNRHTWVRVLYVLGGIAAVAGGAVMLGKDLSPLGDAAAAVAHAAAPKVAAAAPLA